MEANEATAVENFHLGKEKAGGSDVGEGGGDEDGTDGDDDHQPSKQTKAGKQKELKSESKQSIPSPSYSSCSTSFLESKHCVSELFYENILPTQKYTSQQLS